MIPGGFFFLANIIYQELYPLHRRRSARFLAFCFFCGLTGGVLAAVRLDSCNFSLMRGIGSDPSSIVGLMILLLIPFLISLSAFWIDPIFLFPICFVRAFLFGFVHLCLLGCYPMGGHWIRWLLLFSDILSLPVLYFFWYRRALGYPVSLIGTAGLAVFLCGIGIFDFYLVMPFAQLMILQKG